MKIGLFCTFSPVFCTGQTVFQHHLGECNSANVSIKQRKGFLQAIVTIAFCPGATKKVWKSKSGPCIALQILRPSILLNISNLQAEKHTQVTKFVRTFSASLLLFPKSVLSLENSNSQEKNRYHKQYWNKSVAKGLLQQINHYFMFLTWSHQYYILPQLCLLNVSYWKLEASKLTNGF